MEQKFSGIKYRHFGYTPRGCRNVPENRNNRKISFYSGVWLFLLESSLSDVSSLFKRKTLEWKGYVIKSVTIYGKIPFRSVNFSKLQAGMESAQLKLTHFRLGSLFFSEDCRTAEYSRPNVVEFSENLVIIF